MSYEIPKNLRHEEAIIFGLSLWKAFCLSVPLILSLFIFTKTNIAIEIKTLISIISIVLGVGFAFFDLKEKLFSITRFSLSKKEFGFLDKEALNFFGIKQFYDNHLLMKDNRKICIIQVFPVNFSMMKDKEQKAMILNFRDFINSLDYPIQIIAKPSPIELNDYFTEMQQKALKEGNFIYSLFSNYKEFVYDIINKSPLGEKKFYIVVQAPSNKEPETEIPESLLAKAIQCTSKLNESGIKAKVLEKYEIIDLFGNYFEKQPKTKSKDLNLSQIIGC